MNWGGVWAIINEGETLDVDKYRNYGLSGLYVSARALNAGLVLNQLHQNSVPPGLIVDPNWPECPKDPVLAAKWASDRLQEYLPRPWPDEAAPFLLDLEGQPLPWQKAFLATYRQYQPHRPSSVYVQAWQGGLIAPDFGAAGFHVYVSLYYGPHDGLPDMNPVLDPAGAVLEQDRRFPVGTVHPCYGGNNYPKAEAKDGLIFHLQMLP